MQAIVLTPEQSASLLAANAGSNRILEPRQLQDGRLILNADILDDPYFADPAKPWAAILTGEQVTVDPNQAQAGEAAIEVDQSATDSLASLRSEIVTLTDAELAEPQ